ncbi:MAG: caspase family protein [Phycisphaerae bacterium]|nr:caspase family protein [Phycisphaerae bacterium]
MPRTTARFRWKSLAPTLSRSLAPTFAWLAVTMAGAQSPADQTQGSKAVGIDEAIAQVDPAIRPPKRFALLVGVADYQDDRIPDLPACERDARDLAKVLTDAGAGLFAGDQVTTLVNADVTRNAVVAALDELARKAGPDDLVLVYFSGHGATDEKGRAYWVMHDTRSDRLRSTAMPELEISELLGEIRTRRLVTIIDACYSAATAKLGSTKSLLDLQRLFPEFQGDGRIGMTASKGDQLSMVITDDRDPGFGHSAFTYHVIEGMRGLADARGNGDGVIEVDELWGYVKDRTIETARRQGGNQEPQLKGQVGSRFMLAVDGERLKALAEARKSASHRSDGQLEALRKLFIDEAITAGHFEEARALLRLPIEGLSERDRRRREVYTDCAEGRLDPKQLAKALGNESNPRPTPAPAGPAGWPEIVASIAPRFTDVDAPVALAIDVDLLREDAGFGRFAVAAGQWGAPPWSTERGGAPRRAVLLMDPLPATVDATVLLRGAIRQHRGDGTLGALLEGDVVARTGAQRVGHERAYTMVVGPRATLTAEGESEELDRLLERPGNARPGWAAGLESSLKASLPLALVADGPWCVDRLARFAGADGGRIFFGKIFAELMLPDDPSVPEAWSEATAGIQTVAATGQPTGDWTRAAIRIDFGAAHEADRAAPHWRRFLDRLPEWTDSVVRPLDVQVDGRSLMLRLDIRSRSLIDWVDANLALPGSALVRS